MVTLGLLLALQAVPAAPAAATGATLKGSVRDAATGDPVAGALVTLADLDRTASTDSAGRYRLPQVPAGPQHLSVRLVGYAPRTLHALVPAGGELEVNVALEPVPFHLPTVEVRPPIALRGVEADDGAHFPDRSSSMAAAWNHPLLAEPDALGALGGGEVSARPEAPSGLHVRGGAADQTGYLLDDIPVFSPYHAAGIFSAWNPDALAGIRLAGAAPSPAHPHALSGSVAGTTRTPGLRFGARGAVSSSQARLTLDGPIGRGAGYLVSVRSGFPSLAPGDDPSYLHGRTGDRLAKLQLAAFGGELRLLGYDAEDELDAAAIAVEADETPRRNAFEWHSRSLGLRWSGSAGRTALQVLAWHADTDAESDWIRPGGALSLSATRSDRGFSASVEHATLATASLAGLRLERSATSYVALGSDAADRWEAENRAPLATAFAAHSRALGSRLGAGASVAVTVSGEHVRIGPRAQVRWEPLARVTLTASGARLHQFAHSLRNSESVVGTIFPADLYLGVGSTGVPVARNDQAVLAAEYRPAAAVRLGVQGWARSFDQLLLVAPAGGDPFVTAGGGASPFVTGSGSARGLSLDAALSTPRAGIVATYGYQRVRLRSGSGEYVPEYGTPHLLDLGLIVFPTVRTSVRLGVAAGWGRRTTGAIGGLEWESCNLLDRGCEFAGSPQQTGLPPGGVRLPGYTRVDLGFRHHWHVGLGARDLVVGLFGTVTNLLGRVNLLTIANDPVTGERVPVEMRPLAPLVVGLDWRF
jgi:hypothetical protein